MKMENNLIAIETELAEMKRRIGFFTKLKKKPSANWDRHVVIQALEDSVNRKAELMKIKKQLA